MECDAQAAVEGPTPAISRIALACVASARLSSPTSLPSLITSTRLERFSTSGSSDEISQIATPAAARFVEQLVNGDLGTDIDAAGRLVDDQQLAIPGQPFGEGDLLLIAAAQGDDRRLYRTAS